VHSPNSQRCARTFHQRPSQPKPFTSNNFGRCDDYEIPTPDTKRCFLQLDPHQFHYQCMTEWSDCFTTPSQTKNNKKKRLSITAPEDSSAELLAFGHGGQITFTLAFALSLYLHFSTRASRLHDTVPSGSEHLRAILGIKNDTMRQQLIAVGWIDLTDYRDTRAALNGAD